MDDIASTSIDKSGWPAGPWTTEPDRVEFEHAGHPCLIIRHDTAGHLCGYVAVPPGHPWHGRGEGDIYDGPGPHPECHGGVTYAARCAVRVCHVPKPGEPDDVWWLGFDAAHAGDVSPAYLHSIERIGSPTGWGALYGYRTVEYMRLECERLAELAAAVGVEARP